MTNDMAIELCRNTIITTLMLCLPVLLSSIVVGLLISIGQAVTQLQEQTLSFVPKLIAMFAVLLLTMPWLLNVIMEYSIDLYRNIPQTISP